jgi:acetylornithine deacetylase
MPLSDTIAFASSLIRFRSLSGHEGAIADFLVDSFSSRGWNVERLPVADGRDNIFVTFGTPEIVFTTHTDIVPGPDHLFEPFCQNDRLYGRGACDTKGIIATMVAAAEELRERGETNFGLLFVVGEEFDGIGARTAARQLRNRGIRYLINGEPTECKIMRAHKGGLGVTIVAEGVACHSGYPSEGDDANARLIEVLSRIYQTSWPNDPVLGPTTVSCGLIQGGVAANIISPRAEAQLVFRTVSPHSEVISILEQLIPASCRMEIVYDAPVVHLLEVPGIPSDVAAYCTDIPFFAPLRAETVLFGPGSILVAHTDEEHISFEEISKAITGYKQIFSELKQLLRPERPESLRAV